jgi:diguanylate cyclase (GGDEF)-like protein
MSDKDVEPDQLRAELEQLRKELHALKATEMAYIAQQELFENLLSAARSASEALTLEATLQKMLELARRLRGAERGSLFLMDGTGVVTNSILTRRNPTPEQRQSIVGNVMESGLAGWVARNRRTGLICDTLHDERWLMLPDQPYLVRSALALPIIRGQVLLGILTLLHAQPNYFSSEHADLMQVTLTQMSLALDNARLYSTVQQELEERRRVEEELRRQARLLQGVAEAMDYMLGNADHIRAISQALGTLGPATGVDRVYIFQHLLEPTSGEPLMSLRFQWCRESREVQIDDPDWQRIPYEIYGINRWYETLSSWCALGGTMAEFPEHERKVLDMLGIRSLHSVPIFVAEEFWGFLGFAHCEADRRLSPDEEPILFAAAGSIGGALARKRIEEELHMANGQLTRWVNELEQRNREMSLLSEMGELFQSCLAPEEAYTVVAQMGLAFFPNEVGALAMLDTVQNIVEAVATWGPGVPGELVFAPDDCWALRRGRQHKVDGSGHSLICKHLGDANPTRYMCIPMVAQGETLGVLHLAEKEPGSLSEPRQRLAITVAEHIALSLANLRLHETLRKQSICDPLTGIYNRRYMQEALDREIRRSVRSHHPIGVLVVDIDHFKRFNDTFGHDAGDTLLREMGRLLKMHVSGAEMACRFGGEEFVVVLPESTLEECQQRADQLRRAVKNMNVSHNGQPLGPLTVSVGVAIFPDHGPTAEAVFKAADLALYHAKHEGRDQVMTANFSPIPH